MRVFRKLREKDPNEITTCELPPEAIPKFAGRFDLERLAQSAAIST